MTALQIVRLSLETPPAPEIARWMGFVGALWAGGVLLTARGRLRELLFASGVCGLVLYLPVLPEIFRAIAGPEATLLDQIVPTGASASWVADYLLMVASLAALAGVEGRRYGLHWAWVPAVIAAPGIACPALLWRLHVLEHVERAPPAEVPDVRPLAAVLALASAGLAVRIALPRDAALAWEVAYLDASVTPLSSYVTWTIGQLGSTLVVWAIPRFGSAGRRMWLLLLTTLCVAVGAAWVTWLYGRRFAQDAWEHERSARTYYPWGLRGSCVAIVAWAIAATAFVASMRAAAPRDPAEICEQARAERASAIVSCLSACEPGGQICDRASRAAAQIAEGAGEGAIHRATLALAEDADLPRPCRDAASADWRAYSLCPLAP